MESGSRLGGKLLEVAGAVLVGRRNDFEQSDEAVPADMAYRKRTAQRSSGRLDHLPLAVPWRRLRNRGSTSARKRREGFGQGDRRLQRQDIRDEATGVLLCERVEAAWQQAAVQDFLDLSDPRRVKGVKDPGFNARPVVHRHGDRPLRNRQRGF
jgi:hypothetical protein